MKNKNAIVTPRIIMRDNRAIVLILNNYRTKQVYACTFYPTKEGFSQAGLWVDKLVKDGIISYDIASEALDFLLAKMDIRG